jgi:NAD(P)-dependent dehydrogenase (short-subunit alcohol dehydrogenase family)
MDIGKSKALVTGAALRVGREIALTLARAGAMIFLHYRGSREAAERTAEEIRELGAEVVLVQGDLGDAADTARVAEECREADILVNSASIFPRTPLPDLEFEAWDEIFDVNVRGPFFLATRIGLAMKERGRGTIINIADWSGVRPYQGYLPYCVSKAALLAANTGLARAMAPEVRVNAISPGPVMFPEDMGEAEKEKILRKTPLRREGSPQEVAKAVRFLVEGATFSTGAVLTVDGGRLIH